MAEVIRFKKINPDSVDVRPVERKRRTIDKVVLKTFDNVKVVQDDVGQRTYFIGNDLVAQFNSGREVRKLKKNYDKIKEEKR